ncbi:hypothetical protein DUI87_34103 [Hirundo rustica rustica]|uniref:G-protein coupled receptors family 1 profile domain-containing protein n=1 Tax=Hirundo rustica rustica TaxID=333673 RepID=A0A3M0IN31_HIRRU|nr:hypothetical protein DUI87_34103 [Hirundo rustica rustica]
MPELPERPEVAFVLSCLLVFGLALFGKCLVLHVVTRSRAMRTVAHIFVCSLALSDLLVAAFCVPFTVLQNISSKRLGDSEGYCQNMEIEFHNFPQTRMLGGNWQKPTEEWERGGENRKHRNANERAAAVSEQLKL